MISQDVIILELQKSMQIEPSMDLESRIIKSTITDDVGRYCPRRRISMKAALIAATLAVLMVTTTAFAFGEQIIGMFSKELTAAYDANGNLIWRQALDENGNIIYVDYEAEPFEGEVRIKGFEDVFSHNKLDIPCVNGVSVKHIVNNGQVALYINDEGAYSLKRGQAVDITFDVTDRDWWGVMLGYYKDGEYIPYRFDRDAGTDQRYILSGETTIEFIAPEDGEYLLFMVNLSAGGVLVNSCTISY